MPLILAPQGESMQIVRISAEPKTCRHLEDLGITSGADITLLSDAGGNMIVRVHESRLAIDRNTARSIIVRQKTAA